MCAGWANAFTVGWGWNHRATLIRALPHVIPQSGRRDSERPETYPGAQRCGMTLREPCAGCWS
eukprot:4136765-Prymnesium_polylepis.1